MTEVKARTVLWYLVFVGFGVNYMLRINLNITIVEMVASKKVQEEYRKQLSQVQLISDTLAQPILNQPTIAPGIIKTTEILENNINRSESNRTDSNHSLRRQVRELRPSTEGFHWDEYQQGLVLGSFYWAHWVTQIPGGILAKKYGTKIVFGLANVIACWSCLLVPIASNWDYRALIVLRVFQGFITGLSWPAMHVLTARWVPPNERSKFVTAYLGSSVGIAVFYPFFGYVMHWLSWKWVFYFCGLIGSIWWCFWIYFVYDSPAQHPRIKESERLYIEKSLGNTLRADGSIPWLGILTSKPVWMNVIAQWGGIWGLFTLMTQAPTYFRLIHMWDIRATGWLSGAPHIMRMAFAFCFSLLADYLLRSEKMSTTNVRKFATTVCCIVNGFCVLGLAFFGENPVAAVVFLTMALMFHGSVSSGPLASIVDLSPNYAGVVLGVAGMIGVLPGFISPFLVGYLTLDNQTFEAWKNVFIICAGMLIGCGLVYLIFGSSKLQSWNNNTNDGPTLPQNEVHLLPDIKKENNLKNFRDEKVY